MVRNTKVLFFYVTSRTPPSFHTGAKCKSTMYKQGLSIYSYTSIESPWYKTSQRHHLRLFQRELSIIDFTLNYPPIRNNLTSASLLSMLIETDYLNYPPIRNNLTSASLLSMIIEMDYNLGTGMKAGTVPRCRAEICRARNIFFLSRSTKRCDSVFFRSVICK